MGVFLLRVFVIEPTISLENDISCVHHFLGVRFLTKLSSNFGLIANIVYLLLRRENFSQSEVGLPPSHVSIPSNQNGAMEKATVEPNV